MASFSKIGPELDLAAPGVGVISTYPGGYAVLRRARALGFGSLYEGQGLVR